MAIYGKNPSYDLHTSPAPFYKHHQLLGDSQLVRFSEQILSLKRYITESGRGIGFCVCGQTIKDLESRLASTYYAVHPNVILLIGMNDILDGTDIEEMCESYDKIVDNLLKNCHNILLLTVPPVPKLGSSPLVWEKLSKFNRFIKDLCERSRKISVVDLARIFTTYDNTAALDYYEKTYHSSERVDLMHLNSQGFCMLQEAMNMFYFDNKPCLTDCNIL